MDSFFSGVQLHFTIDRKEEEKEAVHFGKGDFRDYGEIYESRFGCGGGRSFEGLGQRNQNQIIREAASRFREPIDGTLIGLPFFSFIAVSPETRKSS